MRILDEDRFHRIERWVNDPGIGSLNEVFERCTFSSPEKRMTMADFVASLDPWLENQARQGM